MSILTICITVYAVGFVVAANVQYWYEDKIGSSLVIGAFWFLLVVLYILFLPSLIYGKLFKQKKASPK